MLRLVSGAESCQSQGKIIEETLANIREAIELFLETLTSPPQSNSISKLGNYIADVPDLW